MSANDLAGSPGGVRSLQAELDEVCAENLELFAAGVSAYDRDRRATANVDDDDPATKARLRRQLSKAKVVREMLTPPQPPEDRIIS